MIIALMDRLGRRSLLSTLLLLGGFSCIIAAYIPRGKVKYDYTCLYLLESIIQCKGIMCSCLKESMC
jgi:hypothetical protein